MQKNNVHVSGSVLYERPINLFTTQVVVGINEGGNILPISTEISSDEWEKFKSNCPETCSSVTISGQLQTRNSHYFIKAFSVCGFHNLLKESLDETTIQFYGRVKLKKKFNFDTASNLYLKRILFETVSPLSKPTVFEAMALRGTAPYFDNISEGTEMMLKTNFVIDKNGNPPYWKIKCQPEIE